jgi:NDP-hexose 4-ketoreductase
MSPADDAGPTLLLTGAQGFLGRHVAVSWLRSHSDGRVVGLGRSAHDVAHFTYGHRLPGGAGETRAALPPAVAGLAAHPAWSYRRVDLTVPLLVREVVRDVQPTAVIHSAAALRGDPLAGLISSNVLATAVLARAVGDLAPTARFVAVSSGSVAGLGSAPADQGSGAEPYAVTKRAGELAAAAEGATSGLSVVSGRVFNLVGPGLQDRHLPGKVALELAAMAPRGGGELRVGSLDAERDLVDVRDAADALVSVASASDAALSRIRADGALRLIDVGTGRAVRMRDLVRMQIEAARLAGRVEVIESESRATGAATLCADPAALAALDVSPRIPLAQTLVEMADYARSQF